jgi:hypothetical protein
MKKKAIPYFEFTDGYDIVRVMVKGFIAKPDKATTHSNWLESVITVKGCTLGGQYSAEFLPIDFHRFRQQLVSLMYGLDKSAIFVGELGYLRLRFQVIKDCFAEISVKACDVPGIGSELTFDMNVRFSDIEKAVKDLDNIVERYPN